MSADLLTAKASATLSFQTLVMLQTATTFHFLVGHVKAVFLLLERWHMERTHSVSFHRKVVMEAFFLVREQFYSVGLNMLLHVVTLDKSPESTQLVKRLALGL